MTPTHRCWKIEKAFIGYTFYHPDHDPENVNDWRYGTADTEQQAREEIDRLLEEDAEWSDASNQMRKLVEEALIKQENDRTLWTPEWQQWSREAQAALGEASTRLERQYAPSPRSQTAITRSADVPVGKLKPQYPDYIDDPDGLARFRENVRHNDGHDMAAVNYNSLGRLIDTIERLRPAKSQPPQTADTDAIARVERVETVPNDHPFNDEETPPIWRVVVGEYVADFDFEQAARNFAGAINAAALSPTHTVSDMGVARVITALREIMVYVNRGHIEGDCTFCVAALEEGEQALAALTADKPDTQGLRELVERAREIVPEFYVNWHAAARTVLNQESR